MAERLYHELEAPDQSRTADQAVEILRAWAIDEHLQCSLNPATFTDHGEWGLFLAELAQHIATGLAQTYEVDADETLTAILARFQAEILIDDDEPPTA